MRIDKEKELENYEKEYLERKLGIKTPEKPLDTLHYILLSYVKKGIGKIKELMEKIPKVSFTSIMEKIKELYKRSLIDENWKRGWDISYVLTDKGVSEIDKKTNELTKIWNEIKAYFDNKDKEKFSEKIYQNRSNLPLFMIMGFTNGMMMGQMMFMMDLNYQALTQGMNYAYLAGYTEGLSSEGGDFGDAGGEGGGFMDGGFQPGF